MKKRKIISILAGLLIAALAVGMMTACGAASIGSGDKEKTEAAATTAANGKHFTFKITAKEAGQNIEIVEDAVFDGEMFGDYLKQYKDCDWEDSEYGIFVKGFCGVPNDDSQQLWWQLFVDGESAQVGADMIELKDGAVYEYVYTLGYDW